jgi:hypothetical protein
MHFSDRAMRVEPILSRAVEAKLRVARITNTLLNKGRSRATKLERFHAARRLRQIDTEAVPAGPLHSFAARRYELQQSSLQ